MPVAVPLIAAGVGAAGAVASSRAQSGAARSAANASQQATDATIAEQRRQYDLSRADQQPWLQTGQSALSQLAGMYGLGSGGGANSSTYAFLQANPQARDAINNGYFGGNGDLNSAVNWYQNEYGGAANPVTAGGAAGSTGTTGNAPGVTAGGANMSGFFASPDYQFRQNEQARALTARNAMLGIQDSGAAQRSAMQLSGNLASGEFQNYTNRLASLAGVGQTAANNTAQLGQNYANSVGTALGNNAQNLSSSYATQGAANGQLYGQLGGIASGLVGNIWGGKKVMGK